MKLQPGVTAIGRYCASGPADKTAQLIVRGFRLGDGRSGQQAGASGVALTKIHERVVRSPSNKVAMPSRQLSVDGPSLSRQKEFKPMQIALDQAKISDRVFRAVQDYKEAQAAVSPILGQDAAAQDASQFYCKALTALGHADAARELRGQPEAARAVFAALKAQPKRQIGMDSSSTKRLQQMFPHMNRLQSR